jgi:hypothetical protein
VCDQLVASLQSTTPAGRIVAINAEDVLFERDGSGEAASGYVKEQPAPAHV